MSSFINSTILINNSFVSWSKSPIETSVATFPISKIPFPQVTICPPKDTNTALNYDLMHADDVTISNDDRNELINLTNILHLDEKPMKFSQYMIHLRDKKLSNYYNGITAYSVPIKDFYNVQEYTYRTTATAGSVSSPGFGKQWHVDLYSVDQLSYRYAIYFPATLYDQAKHGVLVGSLEVDLKETLGGEDSVTFQTFIDGGDVIKYRYITNNISFRYNITMEFSSNKEIYILYKRSLKQDTLNQWNTQRMTGFSFDWHIENDQKEEIRIAAEKKYDGPEWTRNCNLIRWTNSLFNLMMIEKLSFLKRFGKM